MKYCQFKKNLLFSKTRELHTQLCKSTPQMPITQFKILTQFLSCLGNRKHFLNTCYTKTRLLFGNMEVLKIWKYLKNVCDNIIYVKN